MHDKNHSGKLIRSKGYFACNRPQFAGSWSQAGGIARYGCWNVTVPKESWPQDEDSINIIKEKELLVICDKLVFIGQGLDKEQITNALDACLLSDDDLLKGKTTGQLSKIHFSTNGKKAHEYN